MTYYIIDTLPFVVMAVSLLAISYLSWVLIGRNLYSFICSERSDIYGIRTLSFLKSALLILISCGMSAVLFILLISQFMLLKIIVKRAISAHSSLVPGINIVDFVISSDLSLAQAALIIFFILITLITFLSVYSTKRFTRFPIYSKVIMYALILGPFALFFCSVPTPETSNGSIWLWVRSSLILLACFITIRFNYRMIMGHISQPHFLHKHKFTLLVGLIVIMVNTIIPSIDWFVDAREHFDRALVFGDKGQTNQAFTEYCKALDKNPELYDAYFNRGLIYFEHDQTSKALSDFRDYLKHNDEDAQAHYIAGLCQQNKENPLAALSSFSKAISYKPNDAEFYQIRGSVYLHIGLYYSALHDLNRSMGINPEDRWSWIFRAYSHFLTGQYESAIKDYTRLIENDSQDVEARVMRFLCDKKLGQNRFSIPGDLDLSELNRTEMYIVRMVQGALEPEEALDLINRQPEKSRYTANLAYAFAGELYVIKGDHQKALSIFNTPDVFTYPNWVYHMAQKELNYLASAPHP